MFPNLQIITLEAYNSMNVKDRQTTDQEQEIVWQRYEVGPKTIMVSFPIEFLLNPPKGFQTGFGQVTIPLEWLTGHVPHSGPLASNGKYKANDQVTRQAPHLVSHTSQTLDTANGHSKKRGAELVSTARTHQASVGQTYDSPPAKRIRHNASKLDEELAVAALTQMKTPPLSFTPINGPDKEQILQCQEGTSPVADPESDNATLVGDEVDQGASGNASRYVATGASFLELEDDSRTIKEEDLVGRQATGKKSLVVKLSVDFAAITISPADLIPTSAHPDSNNTMHFRRTTNRNPHSSSNTQESFSSLEPDTYYARTLTSGQSQNVITSHNNTTTGRVTKSTQAHFIASPQKAALNSPATYSSPAPNAAMRSTAAVQMQLEPLFRVIANRPYNPGWMADNHVSLDLIKSMTCVPSRQHFSVLCREKVILPGDILRVTFTPSTGGAAVIVKDATILAQMPHPSTGKVRASSTPDCQIALPNARGWDGVMRSLRGPTHLMDEMKKAYPQQLANTDTSRAWYRVNLIRGGRDYGTCYHIRASWCLWIEQHKAIVNNGPYPPLF